MRINSWNFFGLLLVGVFAIPAFSLFSLALDSEAEVWAFQFNGTTGLSEQQFDSAAGCWNRDTGFGSGQQFPDGTLRISRPTLAGMDADAADGDASLYFGNGLPGTT